MIAADVLLDWKWIALSCLLGGLGAWLMARLAPAMGLLDRPNARSSHRRPTPRGGGLGILAAFITVAVGHGLPAVFWLPLAGLSLFAFLGDRVEFSPKLRLAVQFALVSILVVGGNTGWDEALWAVGSMLMFLVFITGTANFYNFMDGINGIAGVTGMVAFLLLGILFQNQPATELYGLICWSMASACLGFLPFNLFRARVFLGDVGSILLGACLAAVICLGAHSYLDWVVGASFLFPFYADELTTMAVRIRAGEDLTRPHRRHLYQILANQGGVPHWQVTLGYGAVQALVGATTLVCRSQGLTAVIVALALFSWIFIALSARWRRALETPLAPA